MIGELAGYKASLEELCRRYKVRRLELFGSAAIGRDGPGESDLDFLVDFEPLPRGGYANAYFGLLEGLQQISGRLRLCQKSLVPRVCRVDESPGFCKLKLKST